MSSNSICVSKLFVDDELLIDEKSLIDEESLINEFVEFVEVFFAFAN